MGFVDNPLSDLEIQLGLHTQSNLAIVIGVLACLGSFGYFAMGPAGFIGWLVSFATGIVLIKLGARQVPDYNKLTEFIFYTIADKIRKSKQ